MGNGVDTLVESFAVRLEPLGCETVPLGPLEAGDLPVGDVSNQYVAERVIRCILATNERALLKPLKCRQHTRKPRSFERRNRFRYKCAPEYRGGVEDVLFRRRQEIEASRDRRLNRLRHDDVVAVLERARELFG